MLVAAAVWVSYRVVSGTKRNDNSVGQVDCYQMQAVLTNKELANKSQTGISRSLPGCSEFSKDSLYDTPKQTSSDSNQSVSVTQRTGWNCEGDYAASLDTALFTVNVSFIHREWDMACTQNFEVNNDAFVDMTGDVGCHLSD